MPRDMCHMHFFVRVFVMHAWMVGVVNCLCDAALACRRTQHMLWIIGCLTDFYPTLLMSLCMHFNCIFDHYIGEIGEMR